MKATRYLRSELKVVLLVIAALITMEVIVRPLTSRMSKDLEHIATFESIADQVQQFGEDRSILLIGNSLARWGVDETILKQGIESHLGINEPEILWMVPDGTSIIEWAPMYRRYLLERDVTPAVTIIFSGPHHLRDTGKVRPEALGAYYVSGRDRLNYAGKAFQKTDDRAKFLLASVSDVFANRRRVRPLLFYNLVPGYEKAARDINAVASGEATVVSETEVEETTDRLQDFLSDFGNSSVYFALIPIPSGGSFSPEIKSRLEAAIGEKSVIADLPELPVDELDFPDNYHLGPESAQRYTKLLVERLWGDRP